MTENEYRLLRHIRVGDPISYDHLDDADRLAFRCLTRDRLILREWFSGQLVLTDAGLSALTAEEQRLEDQRSQQARDQLRRDEERFYQHQQAQKHFRHDWRIAIFTTLAGFVLGMAGEHFFDIVGNTVRLWRMLLF